MVPLSGLGRQQLRKRNVFSLDLNKLTMSALEPSPGVASNKKRAKKLKLLPPDIILETFCGTSRPVSSEQRALKG